MGRDRVFSEGVIGRGARLPTLTERALPTSPQLPPSNPRMSALIRDMTNALRTFRSARVFAATAVLTLALGIGGTTAIFTLMHAVMLKSLPVSDPSRLYRIGDGD